MNTLLLRRKLMHPRKEEPAPTAKAYVKLSAPSSFSLSASKGWNGTMEYSLDGDAWQTWSGSSISGTEIYLRGVGNNTITNGASGSRFVVDGNSVAIGGTLAALLDFATVEAGEHPTMNGNAFRSLFYNNTASITDASGLVCPSENLASSCLRSMFYNCAALVSPPILPATTLAESCYQHMFYNCTALTSAPALPATQIHQTAYMCMFQNTNLRISTLPSEEYNYEFRYPIRGTGSINDGSTSILMFENTGGIRYADINTTYYANFPSIE